MVAENIIICKHLAGHLMPVLAIFLMLALASVDALASSQPSQPKVRLDGLLGERFSANQKRLLIVDEEELLGGFRHRPGKQAWIGEHLGKWMHAAALTYGCTHDQALRAKLDRVAIELMKTQESDGYLGTYISDNRFCFKQDCEWDVWVHKYNLIGLLTYYQYTGNKEALEACKRIAGLLINTFGPGKKSIISTSHFKGMASTSVLDPIMTLYNITGDSRYLAFAEYIVSSWEEPDGPHILSGLLKGEPVYTFGDGKAYEFMSNVIGLCKLYAATGKKDYLTAVLNAWKDISANRLYITGSGSNWERWRHDFFFPNANKVGDEEVNLCETCVTVTWMQLNALLLSEVGGAQFAEQIERTLYNHLLASQKPTGEAWCQYPPLEGTKLFHSNTNCCLSSGPRGIALIPTFMYAATPEGIDVNVFGASKATARLAKGGEVNFEQKTRYPLDGKVVITVNPVDVSQPFTIRLRVPAWSPKVSVNVNGKPWAESTAESGYVSVKRHWSAGDTIACSIDMSPRIVLGDHMNQGRAAVMYGPLVLAADASHNPGIEAVPQEAALAVDDPARLVLRRTDLSSGRFETDGLVCGAGSKEASRITLTLVPYYLAGVDGSAFAVWLKRPPASNPAQ